MLPDCVITEPVISQRATSLLLLSRQRMSPLPSPLKSPVPTTDQVVPTVATVAGEACRPFMNQIAVVPVLPSRQSKSALPSPSKSRCATICQLVVTVPSPPDCRIDEPFISQTAT